MFHPPVSYTCMYLFSLHLFHVHVYSAHLLLDIIIASYMYIHVYTCKQCVSSSCVIHMHVHVYLFSLCMFSFNLLHVRMCVCTLATSSQHQQCSGAPARGSRSLCRCRPVCRQEEQGHGYESQLLDPLPHSRRQAHPSQETGEGGQITLSL